MSHNERDNRDANTATTISNRLKTSQLAFPNDIGTAAYNGSSGCTATITVGMSV